MVCCGTTKPEIADKHDWFYVETVANASEVLLPDARVLYKVCLLLHELGTAYEVSTLGSKTTG